MATLEGSKANCTAALSGILTLENMTTGRIINSPGILNNFGNSEIWTQISYFNIDQNNIYKAAFNASSTDLNSLNSYISLVTIPLNKKAAKRKNLGIREYRRLGNELKMSIF